MSDTPETSPFFAPRTIDEARTTYTIAGTGATCAAELLVRNVEPPQLRVP